MDKYIKAVLIVIALCAGSGTHAGSFEVAKGRYCSELEKDVSVIGDAWITTQDFKKFADYFASVTDEKELKKLDLQSEQILTELENAELNLRKRGFSEMTVEKYESMLERLLSKWADICK